MTNLNAKTFKGYGCKVQWDGTTLTARGSNKFTHFALAGPAVVEMVELSELEKLSHKEQFSAIGSALLSSVTSGRPLVLKREDILFVEYKPAKGLTNGKLVLQSARTGRIHEFHFLKKQTADFDALVADLT